MSASLQNRDGLLAKTWHIVCLSKELQQKPIQRIIYDVPYVLFRDSQGNAACLVDRCLHRHALLSKGTCSQDNLICPYHGWRYDKEGKVTSIPSEGMNFESQKHKTKSYPLIEQDGVIWIWTFEEEPGDIKPWRFPKSQDKTWVHYFMVTDFENEVTNLMENFMDVPHTVFVHQGWFRNKSQTKVPMVIETKNARVLVTYNQENDKIAPLLKPLLNPRNEPMLHTDEFIFPNITNVTYSYGDHYGLIINSQCTPVSAMKTRVYTYMGYKLSAFNRMLKPFVNYYTRKVIEQDVIIMANQGQSLTFNPRTSFRSTPADEVHKAIERLRSWGETDLEKVYSYENKTSSEFWV